MWKYSETTDYNTIIKNLCLKGKKKEYQKVQEIGGEIGKLFW